MKEIPVKVQNDHLERMIAVKTPVLAVAELIWNALDAEAGLVEVTFDVNDLGAAEKVVIKDDGHGMQYEDAEYSFGNLGGSWKKLAKQSKNGVRRLHGQKGQGRFKAFALGSRVTWKTCYKTNGHFAKYSVLGRKDHLMKFTIDDEPKLSKTGLIGTQVTIDKFENGNNSLLLPKAFQVITEQFALYLSQYPNIAIIYEGNKVDPKDAIENQENYDLGEFQLESGRITNARLTIIEWKNTTDRALYLCDTDGFAVSETKPNIQAPGFNFTAYLKSDFIRELEEQNLVLEDLSQDLKKIVTAARAKLKDHFRKRAAENSSKLVEEWKEEKIYPYEGEAKNIIEETERQVFDVVALSLHEYLPDFETSDRKNKKLTFTLLKQAIEESPAAVQRIFGEVLELPKEKQKEFAELLEKTSLTAIINASKQVTDRLDFLRGLELLVFNDQSKKQLLERSQLHKILAERTWIFGEEFNLTVNDQSLTEVLEKHLELLRKPKEKNKKKLKPVIREDGSTGIVDLMLSRRVPQPRAEEREHLIVELKRPTQDINQDVAAQIKSYAFAVDADERFRDTKTKWHFWVISNDIADSVRKEANQKNRPKDLLYDDEEGRVYIWVKTWGQLIEGCRARLEFFQKELNYSAQTEDAIAHLRKVHEKYLPPFFIEKPKTEE
jgi:hypothetical protein